MCLPSSLCQGDSGELGLPGAIGEKVSIYSLAFYYKTMQLLVINEDETKYIFSFSMHHHKNSLQVLKCIKSCTRRRYVFGIPDNNPNSKLTFIHQFFESFFFFVPSIPAAQHLLFLSRQTAASLHTLLLLF